MDVGIRIRRKASLIKSSQVVFEQFTSSFTFIKYVLILFKEIFWSIAFSQVLISDFSSQEKCKKDLPYYLKIKPNFNLEISKILSFLNTKWTRFYNCLSKDFFY